MAGRAGSFSVSPSHALAVSPITATRNANQNIHIFGKERLKEMTDKTTAVPEQTAAEALAEYKYGRLVKAPAEMSMVERARANADVTRIVRTATSGEGDESVLVLEGLAQLVEYVRDHWANDVAQFDEETRGASEADVIEFVRLWRDALGE